MHQRQPSAPSIPERRYWAPFAVAVVLLLVVDPLTTLWAVSLYGPSGEANPLMRWAIRQSPMAFGLANVAALAVCVYCFTRVVRTIRTAPAPYGRYLARGVELWLALLVAVGLFVCANNLSVVLRGHSLL